MERHGEAFFTAAGRDALTRIYEEDRKDFLAAFTKENILRQIEEKRYETDLLARGIPADNILRYGFAFRGKECLIRKK